MVTDAQPGTPAEEPEARVIRFAGLDWWVKSSTRPVGPGPNWFSDSPANVRVDSGGALHLAITRDRGVQRCAEVVCTSSLGYGTYRWLVAGDTTAFAPEVVLGLFTWSDHPAWAHREIDVELSRWSNRTGPEAWYAVQRSDLPDDPISHGFRLPRAVRTVHEFTWAPGTVAFQTAGSGARPYRWSYSGPHVPQPGDENPRMNLWLHRGTDPVGGSLAISILAFRHQPLGAP